MNRTVLPFPVLPGKTQADITLITDRFNAEPEAYLESRRRAGVTLERVYLQRTPMGDFVIAYAESDRSAPDVVAAYLEGATEIDRFFLTSVKELTGIDFAVPPTGPPPETVGEWVDSEATDRGRGMAFCAPLIPGQEDRGRAWATATFGSPEMTTSRRALGQNVEVVTITYSPAGPVAAVYLEGVDAFEANRGFAASQEPFDVRFKEELKSLFPPFVDFNQPVSGVTELFDSTALTTRV